MYLCICLFVYLFYTYICICLFIYLYIISYRHLNDTGVKSLAGETKEETKATVEWLKWETSILKAKFFIACTIRFEIAP